MIYVYIYVYAYVYRYYIYFLYIDIIYIYCILYISPSFSEKPALKLPSWTSSSWTPPIRDVQLELYLSEIETDYMIMII